jgi:hypothetical protein
MAVANKERVPTLASGGAGMRPSYLAVELKDPDNGAARWCSLRHTLARKRMKGTGDF